MNAETKKPLSQRFKELPTGTRTAIVGGGVLATLFTIGTIVTDNPPPASRNGNGIQKDPVTVYRPGTAETTEGVAASLEAAKKQLVDQQGKILLLQEQVAQSQKQGGANDSQWSEIGNLTAQIQALQERVNGMSSAGTAPSLPNPAKKDVSALSPGSPSLGAAGLSTPLPSPGAPTLKESASAAPVAIQIVGTEKKVSARADAKKDVPAAYIPSGSNFEAVLLNGMDASTSIGANRNPTPALLRVKTDAILPNLFSFNVRECFVMVGGFGNMSSERVEMRTETMSCIAEDGAVYEGKIEGYLVGEDGKAGARGRVVSKQGALLAKSFMAGFVGGIGGAFSPQPVQSLNLSGSGTQSYQMPNPEVVVGSGIATGLNRSTQALSTFYIKLAEQMFPIVELDAGRKMTIILLKGVELKMDKKG